jgi:hypothetical protein
MIPLHTVKSLTQYRDFGLLPNTHAMRVLLEPTKSDLVELAGMGIPAIAYGSREAVDAWMQRKGRKGVRS